MKIAASELRRRMEQEERLRIEDDNYEHEIRNDWLRVSKPKPREGLDYMTLVVSVTIVVIAAYLMGAR